MDRYVTQASTVALDVYSVYIDLNTITRYIGNVPRKKLSVAMPGGRAYLNSYFIPLTQN